MHRFIVISLVGLLSAAGAAGAQAPTSPSSSEIVAARQSALNMSAVTLGAMKTAIDAGGTAESQRFASRALARWAQAMPSLFPAGTSESDMPGATRAKTEIWTDRAGFDTKAQDYVTATQRLNELAREGDTPGFAAQWAVVRETCSACHTGYRSDPPA